MSKQIFSLDIRDDLVTGVMLIHSKKVRVVSGCAVASVGSVSSEEAITDVVQQLGYCQEPCYVSFGAENFFFRNLQLPFFDRKKISKMLLYQLEETAPININNLLVDCIIGRTKGEETDVVAAMCDRHFLVDRLAFLKSIGVDPEKISIGTVHTVLNLISGKDTPDDFVFLDVGLKRVTIIPVLAGNIMFVRSVVFDPGVRAGFRYDCQNQKVSVDRPEVIKSVLQAFGVVVKQTLLTLSPSVSDYQSLPFLIGGPVGMMGESIHYFKETLGLQCGNYNVLQQPLLKLDSTVREEWAFGVMDHALAQAIISPKEANCINFRKDGFAKNGHRKHVRKIVLWGGGLMFFLVVVGIGFLWVDISSSKDEKAMLDKEIRTVFTRTLPQVKRIVSPLQQLKTRLKEMQRSSFKGDKKGSHRTMMDLLSELSARISPSLEVKIVRLVIDKNGLLLKGTTDNYNSVDNLKKKIEESVYFKTVKINSSNLAPKSSDIRFELKVEMNEL